jgi:hypothetical protein
MYTQTQSNRYTYIGFKNPTMASIIKTHLYEAIDRRQGIGFLCG